MITLHPDNPNPSIGNTSNWIPIELTNKQSQHNLTNIPALSSPYSRICVKFNTVPC